MIAKDLISARERIACFEHWCQEHEGLTEDRKPASAHASICVQRDALGACRAMSLGTEDREPRVFAMERHLQRASKYLLGRTVSHVNDGENGEKPSAAHQMILMVFDFAIKHAGNERGLAASEYGWCMPTSTYETRKNELEFTTEASPRPEV